MTTRIPLKHLSGAPVVNGLGLAGEHEDRDWPRYIRTTDISDPRSLRIDTFASQPPEIAAKAPVVQGDILMTAAGATIGKSVLILESSKACYAGFLVRFRPGPKVDGRFIAYWMQSSDYWSQIDMGAVRSTIDNFSAWKYQNLMVPLPPLEEQRRIADFLDDQVARIDAVAAIREQQRSLVEASMGGIFDAIVAEEGVVMPRRLDGPISSLPVGWRVAELAHVLRQLTNGFVGPTRDILTDEGVRYIQSLHIKDGRINFDRGPYFVSEQWHRDRPRINLRAGDVLIVQTGDIGQVAVVPEGFGEASCHALQIARVEPEVISSEYLGDYLRSDFGKHQLLSRATGALHPHLEAGIKSAPVLLPSIELQMLIVSRIYAQRIEASETVEALDRALALLAEYKRSVITAAVTGELDVATARSGVAV